MQKSLFLYVCLVIASLAFTSCEESHEQDPDDEGSIVQVGQMLPSFAVVTNSGSEVSNLTLQGSASVIVFFATTCSDCKRELPKIQALYEEMKDDVQFVCISRAQSASDVAAYWQEHSFTLPYSAQSDKTVYNLFAEKTIPRVYVSDASGRVRYMFIEQLEASDLRAAIEDCK